MGSPSLAAAWINSIKETGTALGLNEQTAKTRLYRARQHLRPLLAPIWEEETL